jgi:hypothetical protein
MAALLVCLRWLNDENGIRAAFTASALIPAPAVHAYNAHAACLRRDVDAHPSFTGQAAGAWKVEIRKLEIQGARCDRTRRAVSNGGELRAAFHGMARREAPRGAQSGSKFGPGEKSPNAGAE